VNLSAPNGGSKEARHPGGRPAKDREANLQLVAGTIDQLLSEGSDPTLNAVSARLGKDDPRTIQRWLQLAGTTFTSLEATRRGATNGESSHLAPARRVKPFTIAIFERRDRPGHYRAFVPRGPGL